MKEVNVWLVSLAVGVGIYTQASAYNLVNVNGQIANEHITAQPLSAEWQLVETHDGVSCYSRIDPLGSGTGIYLRFENNSGVDVTVNWNVSSTSDAHGNGKVAITAGQIVDSSNQPLGSDLLAVRIDGAQSIVSFTVSK